MEPYIGEIRMFAGQKPPVNWHVCDGSVLSISAYNTLYSLLGTIYGGDGVSTFGIPDLRGRAIVNQGKSLAGTNYTIAQKGGAELVTLEEANIPTHTHTFTVSASTATQPLPTNNFLAAPDDPTAANKTLLSYLPSNTTGLAKVNMNAAAVSDSGESGEAHENRQPFIPMNYIISLAGLYPTFP